MEQDKKVSKTRAVDAKANAKVDAKEDVSTPSNVRSLVPHNGKSSSVAKHPIDQVLVAFLNDIRAIQQTHQLVIPHVLTWLKEKHEANAATLEKYASDQTDSPDIYMARTARDAAEMMNAVRALDGLGGFKIPHTLLRSLFTQLFSEYDAFIGALLKVIYTNKSELLKGISRQITFADLLAYENLNAVKLDMLDKEVETFRRDSYVEQFSNLESKFGLKLKGFPEWSEFVEISQRRNLIVHNGGAVSDQYLLICDREGYKFSSRPRVGQTLTLDGKYFGRARTVISKVAFMLSHTLWRKLFPDQCKIAHEAANDVLYEILKDKRWKTASAIATFCLSPPMRTGIEEIDLRVRIVNSAIAAKFSGEQGQCEAILESLDWSASYRDFKLAISVLKDDFDSAAAMMKTIGKSGEIVREISYHEWPLFFKFRESPQFLNAYKEIYGVSFVAEVVRHSAEAAHVNESKIATDLEAIDVDARPISAEPRKRRRKRPEP